jgi:spore germination protein GerM
MRRYLKRYFLVLLILFLSVSLFFNFYSKRSTSKIKILVKDRASQRLVMARVNIPNTESPNERISWVLKELISGPTQNQYEAMFNPNTDVQKVIIREGVAYVYFGWMLVESLQDEPVLALRAIVNSVFLNHKEIDGVKILIEGIEPVCTFSTISLNGTFDRPI